MQVIAALTQIQKNPDLPGFFVVALQGYEYPSAFLSGFFHRIKAMNGELTFLDTSTHSLNDCKAQLEMSFLGLRKLYVLRNLHALDAAAKKTWRTYLQGYTGPHGVLLYESLGKVPRGRKAVSKAPKKPKWADSETQLLIEVPATIDMRLYSELFSFFYPGVTQDPPFVQSLFAQQRALSVDDACRMMWYQTVVGRKCASFYAQWYSKLVVSEASLFTLSQYFLGRNPKLFLRQWKACKDDYPPEFWVAYWSEQIWQAAQFVITARAKGVAEAKKGFYRLPFTFLNTDWQSYSAEKLVNAHDELYAFDHYLKNGGGSYALELWYHRFLGKRE